MQLGGKLVVLDGQKFCVSLPQGGSAESHQTSLWDKALDACGDSDELWHWKNCFSWCADRAKVFEINRIVRGCRDAKGWSYRNPLSVDSYIGFRPMLWPIAIADIPDCSVFQGVPNGTILRAFSLLCGDQPCRTDETQKWPVDSKLVFADRYFGDEYLIPWVVFDGKAMAGRNLLRNISWESLLRQGYCIE